MPLKTILASIFLAFSAVAHSAVGNDVRVEGGTSISHDDHDIVAIAYNSYDARSETLVFASFDENENTEEYGTNVSTLNAGMGQHLWQIDSEGPELQRGWMFRLRLTIQAVLDEYNRRGQKDFIAMVSDAADVYVSRSMNGKTLEALKQRFLNDFSEHKIVFSTQIYCCNPWELHSFGRKDWDRHYETVGEPSSIYKHLNAGLYIGYASAIIEMGEQMQLWEKDYHRHEGFHSLVGTDAEQYLHMADIEVDDDEWQISAWFFRDQAKDEPLAALDMEQHLFAVTGTFRAEARGEGYIVFSQDHFRKMFGPFPSSFSFEDLDQLTVCPFDYDADHMEWTNKITGGHPLIFHFAGNDWLCACTVFATEGFQGITGHFRDNCRYEFDNWWGRVQEGIQSVAHDEDVTFQRFLEGDDDSEDDDFEGDDFEDDDSEDEDFDDDEDDHDDRLLEDDGPYDRRLDRELRRKRPLPDDGPYDRRLEDDGPYDRRELRRKLRRDDDGPYDRFLEDDGPYDRRLSRDLRRKLSPVDDGPYDRRLDRDLRRKRPPVDDDGPYGRRELRRKRPVDDGPYDRRLDRDLRRKRPSVDDNGPYDRRELRRKRPTVDDGPYDRRLHRDLRRKRPPVDDDGPYDRRELRRKRPPVDDGPYDRRDLRRKRPTIDDGPYNRRLSRDLRRKRPPVDDDGPYGRRL